MQERDQTGSPDDGAITEDACPMCGSQAITTREKRDEYVYGTGASAVTLQIDLPVRQCESCHFEYLDHESERLIHNAVCRHLGFLSPDEVKAIRKRNEMSRADFAKVTGLGEATIGRWEAGTVIQNCANDRYLRLLDEPRIMQKLKSLVGQSKKLSEQQPALDPIDAFPGAEFHPN